jgi:acyl carrier protein
VFVTLDFRTYILYDVWKSDGTKMTIRTQQQQSVASKPFPLAEVEARLRRELGKAASESDVLRGSWEPSLDSLRMVSVLVKLEDLLDFDLRPEKVVRKGGYHSVEEGVDDMRNRLQILWKEHHSKGEVS